MNPKRGSEGQNQDGDNASYKGENGNQIFPHYYVDYCSLQRLPVHNAV